MRLLLTVGSRCIAFGWRDAAFEKAWQNFLKSYSGFVQCRQGVSELTAVTYGVGLFGLSRRVPAKSVEE